jgi:hypothetical protein
MCGTGDERETRKANPSKTERKKTPNKNNNKISK